MKLSYLIIALLIFYSCKEEQKEDKIYQPKKYYEKAKEFANKSSSDSAFYYFNLAKNDYLNSYDSTGAGKSLVNMAIIQHNNGDYYGSIETSLEANKLLKNENDSIVKSTLAANYNNMAISSSFLKNYNESVDFYKKALQFSNDNKNRYIYSNNIGDAFILLGKYTEAKKYLKIALLTKDSLIYAKALNNIARAKFLEDKNYNPLPELYKALYIRQNNKDLSGQNSSFSTLADFYLDKEPQKSLFFASKLLETAEEIKIPEDQINALQRLISLNPSNYLKNFQRLSTINDSTQTARNKAKNQFAVVRYDVEQKNAENQNLKLKDVENKINILYLTFGLAVLILILIVGFLWNEKRKKNIRREKEQEKQIEVKNTELKYSKKVHDVVANGLYHLMIEIENNPSINIMKILNDMEKMYEESRDISHDRMSEVDFHERFGKMINSYQTDNQKVIPIKYIEKIWEKIPQNTQSELFYVIREILVNMKKHSDATFVALKFEKDDTSLRITYTDNGKGIKNLDTQRGAGIRNTENRIDTIGGDIIFEENPNGGLIIKITIPIHSKYV